MVKLVRFKVIAVMIGTMVFAGTGLYAGMNCAAGKCGGGMKMEMKGDAGMEEMPCGCQKGTCTCAKKEGMKEKCDKEMKEKCGEGMKGEMKKKMKGEMKGKCAAGKCGGM